MTTPRTVTLVGFVKFDADYASSGDLTPFRWVRGTPSQYGEQYEREAVAQLPITFTLPADFHPTAAMVSALEAERETVKREFTARIAELNEKIGKLLAITNEVR